MGSFMKVHVNEAVPDSLKEGMHKELYSTNMYVHFWLCLLPFPAERVTTCGSVLSPVFFVMAL